MWDILKVKKAGLFAGGVLFGTAGVKLLSSKDAKKFYTNCTAAVLRAKDSLMKTATTVQENAGDILSEAQQINEERAAKESAEAEIVEDIRLHECFHGSTFWNDSPKELVVCLTLSLLVRTVGFTEENTGAEDFKEEEV